MRCTEVADRPVPDGLFYGRDIGDRGRYPAKPSAFPVEGEIQTIIFSQGLKHESTSGTNSKTSCLLHHDNDRGGVGDANQCAIETSNFTRLDRQ